MYLPKEILMSCNFLKPNAQPGELEIVIRNGELIYIDYLEVLADLELVPIDAVLLADVLDVGGGVRQSEEHGGVMLRTETKGQFNEGRGLQLGCYVPDKDWGPGASVESLDSDNLVREDVKVEHLKCQLANNFEGGFTAGFVTRRDTCAVDGNASFHIVTRNTVDVFLNETLQSFMILGELGLALLEVLLPLLQGGQSRFSGGHAVTSLDPRNFSDKNRTSGSMKGNVSGLAAGAVMCCDFNPVSSFICSTVQVYHCDEETRRWDEFNRNLIIFSYNN